MRKIASMLGLASAGLIAARPASDAAVLVTGEREVNRVYGARAIQHATTQGRKNASNLVSRSRSLPHQGEREIARRVRQAARDEQRQRERADNNFGAVAMNVERLSRRGRPVVA